MYLTFDIVGVAVVAVDGVVAVTVTVAGILTFIFNRFMYSAHFTQKHLQKSN